VAGIAADDQVLDAVAIQRLEDAADVLFGLLVRPHEVERSSVAGGSRPLDVGQESLDSFATVQGLAVGRARLIIACRPWRTGEASRQLGDRRRELRRAHGSMVRAAVSTVSGAARTDVQLNRNQAR
jgi:hypothetical protein